MTKEVTTGLENTIYVEIVEGLEEGDIVYAASKVSKKDEKEAKEREEEAKDASLESGNGQMPEGMGFEMPEGFPGGMEFEMPEGMNMPDIGGQMPDFGR